jgi:N-acetylneuraminic acid mutarotase
MPARRTAMRKGCRRRLSVRPVVAALEPRLLFHAGHDTGGGLVATYFNSADFTAPALTRTDRAVDFYWGTESPAPAVGADTLSARWTGNLLPQTSEPYTFTLSSDGGVRLTLNGQVLIDALTAAGGTFTERSGSIALTQNAAAAIRLDYVEQTGDAGVRLYWQTPTIARQIVPSNHLEPGQATPPEAPPTPPTGFAVGAISVSQTRLTWTDTADNETGFQILRSAILGPAAVIAAAPADAGEFVDSGLTPGVRYFYRLRATSPIGDSEWADYANTVADGVGEPLQPPAPPGGLTAAVQGGAVALSWLDRSASESQFVVARRASAGSAFEDVATVGADVTTYTDADVSPGVGYEYRVRARSAIGDSAASNVAGATVPAVEPPPPDGEAFTEIDWSTGTAGPLARSEAQAGTVDGKLYVFGGFNTDTEPLSRADVYDPAADEWTRLADLPTRLTHAGTATVGRSIYFAGGYIGVNATGGRQQFGVRDVWRYDVDTNTYARMPDLPNRRGSGALVALGNELHYFGGNNSDREDVGTHFVLNLNGGTAWTTAVSLPNPRSHMGYAAVGGKIYAVGGQRGNDAQLVTQGDVDVWDPAHPDEWTDATSIPQAVSHISSSTFVMHGRIIVLGGETAHQAAVRTNWAYDPATDTWTELTRLPTARRSGAAGVIDGVLYYTSGSKSGTTFVGTPVLDGD